MEGHMITALIKIGLYSNYNGIKTDHSYTQTSNTIIH